MKFCKLLLITLAFCAKVSIAQQDSILHTLPSKYLTGISSKTGELSKKLDKKSEKAISQLQKKEEKIRRKLFHLDSSKAKEVFSYLENLTKVLRK